MKKYIFLVFFLFLPIFVYAEAECPIGVENDPAPGLCAIYTDKDNNRICDLSEDQISSVDINTEIQYTEHDLKEMTIAQVASVYRINATTYAKALSDHVGSSFNTNDTLLRLHDEFGLCSGVAGAIALDIQGKGGSAGSVLGEKESVKTIETTSKKITPRYKLIPILIATLFLYLITWSLVGYKKITLLTHKRIWNVVLLITFLVSAVLGILLIFRVNFGLFLDMPFNMLYWHVEVGTVMAILTTIHIAQHWRYFTCMFQKRKIQNCDSK